MDRRRYELEPPTFAQTVAIVRDVWRTHPREDFSSRLETIRDRHQALGFQCPTDQIHAALQALTAQRTRLWDHNKRRSGSSRT
jgi:hypothetical protein